MERDSGVHVTGVRLLERTYKENLRQYVWEHSGQYVLLLLGEEVGFYKTRRKLDRALEQYGNYNVAYFAAKIPKEFPAEDESQWDWMVHSLSTRNARKARRVHKFTKKLNREYRKGKTRHSGVYK